MDPTEALKLAREEAARFTKMFDKDDGDDDDIIEVANDFVSHFLALDAWIAGGGFQPEQWHQHAKMGRPRRTTVPVKLKGVEHGKRSSYNKGCRCMACTGANREAGVTARARKREKSA